jgi:DNA-binding NtrC family response regulator
MGREVEDISPRALSCLLAYEWPGNVRELQNAMERAVVMSRNGMVTPRELPQDIRDQDEICLTVPERGGGLTEILEDLERQLIVQTLRREKGSQTRTAEVLGIKRTTLRYKMEKYGLLERTE